MNKTSLVLAATLAANLALAGYVLWSHPASAAPSASATAARTSKTSVAGPAGGTAAANAPRAAGAFAVDLAKLNISPAEWQTLVTGDLKDLVARLRDAGIPQSAISLMINALVRERFQDRYQEVYGFNGEVPPFWKPEASAGLALSNSPERRAAQQALSKEMSEMIRDALGISTAPATSSSILTSLQNNPEMLANYRRQYGDLSPEKIAAIQETTQKFSQAQADVRSALTAGIGSGMMLPEDQAKIAEIDQQRRAAIAALLTPEEFEAYEMHSSTTANQLKSQLAAFDPTEDEYKAIFRLQKAFDEKNIPVGSATNVQQMQERQKNLLAFQEEVADSLPPDRAEAYRLSLLPGAPQVPRLIARLELPAATALDVLAIQKDLQDRAKEVQATVVAERTAEMTAARGAARGAGARGADLTAAVNAASQQAAATYTANLAERLGQINQEAATKLTSILGPNGYEAYKTTGGNWLQQLTPPAARGPAVPAGAPAATIINR